MQVPVEELIIQAELEAQYDQGFDEGILEGKDEVILNMLDKSVDESNICEFVNCSIEHVLELKNKHFANK